MITKTEPVTTRPKSDDDLSHIFCDCSPEVSLCGLDISDQPTAEELGDDELLCVVCDYEEEYVCQFCGE